MIRIAAEPFSSWHIEAVPLFLAHWEEVATNRDAIPLCVDTGKIITLERAGLWHAWTVRADGVLVGYCCVLVAPHVHYMPHSFAYVDVIYIAPEHRKGGVAVMLIRAMEAGLPQASKIIFHVKIEHDFGALLERLGYVATEKNYEKLTIVAVL